MKGSRTQPFRKGLLCDSSREDAADMVPGGIFWVLCDCIHFLGTVLWKCFTSKLSDSASLSGSTGRFFVRSSGLMPAIVRDPLKVRDVRILWPLQFLPWPRNSTDTKWVLVNVSHAFLKCKQVEWYPRMLNPCAGTNCPGRMLEFVSQMILLNLKFRRAALSDPRRPIQGTQETQKDLSQET